MKLHRILVAVAAVFVLSARSQGGLVGFWNFDQTSGTTAFDTSGSGINGILSSTGAAFDPGAGPGGGGAVSLSSGGYVDMGNNYAFSGTQSFTVQAWIETTSTFAAIASRTYSENDNGYFVGLGNLDPVGGQTLPGCTNSTYNDKASGAINNDTGNAASCSLFTPPSSGIVDNGQWHQVVIAAGGGNLSLYVDGAFQGSVSGVNIYSCPTVDFLVGGIDAGVSGPAGYCNVGTDTGLFSGLISDVAVWNNTLSAAQVSLLYQNPNNPFVAAAPEPAAFGLLAAGLGSLLVLRRKIVG